MRYLVLATDYDSTIAHEGYVNNRTLDALQRLLDSGRKLVLVSGRELDELISIFPAIRIFEWVVAENGAVIYQPSSKQEKRLAEPPPEAFIACLRQRGVAPMAIGQVIVATREPNEIIVIEAIRDLGLELQVIFNKGAVMVLPTGVTKATGLAAVLAQMGLSKHNAIAVGDAENDHHFLSVCECSAAVANALPAVKERVDLVTNGFYGDGVIELIDRVIATDLAEIEDRLSRHHLLLGYCDDKRDLRIPSHGTNLLITGPAATGKSTMAATVLDRLAEAAYQFCVIDPVGDHTATKHAVALGTSGKYPALDDIDQLFSNPDQSGIVNLSGLPLAKRPEYFLALLARLENLRARAARPHWIVVEEAHQMLPAALKNPVKHSLSGMIFITGQPQLLSADALASTHVVVTLGDTALPAVFSTTSSNPEQAVRWGDSARNEAVVWQRRNDFAPVRILFSQAGK